MGAEVRRQVWLRLHLCLLRFTYPPQALFSRERSADSGRTTTSGALPGF
jgi:hypothetical protein